VFEKCCYISFIYANTIQFFGRHLVEM